MVGSDTDFSKLVQNDDRGEYELHEGADFDERLSDIVGFKREGIENLNKKKKMTTAQKIEKELAYVTQAIDLDKNLQKHWYYRLKREYEAQESMEKKMAQK